MLNRHNKSLSAHLRRHSSAVDMVQSILSYTLMIELECNEIFLQAQPKNPTQDMPPSQLMQNARLTTFLCYTHTAEFLPEISANHNGAKQQSKWKVEAMTLVSPIWLILYPIRVQLQEVSLQALPLDRWFTNHPISSCFHAQGFYKFGSDLLTS